MVYLFLTMAILQFHNRYIQSAGHSQWSAEKNNINTKGIKLSLIKHCRDSKKEIHAGLRSLVGAKCERISVPAEAKYGKDFNTSDKWLKSISALLIQSNA